MDEGNDIDQNNQLTNESNYETQIFEIQRMINEYAEKGDYDNAQVCISKIQELRECIQHKKKKEIEEHQISEIDTLQSSYQDEFDRANDEWNTKFELFNEKYQNLEANLNEKHIKDMEALYASLETKFNQKVNFSKDYLVLDQQEQQLVKFQRFKEAGVIRKRKEMIRNKDIDNFNREKNIKIKNQVVQRSSKHQNEKDALKRKYEIELEILEKQKNEVMKRIGRRFQNKRIELDIQQKNERNVNKKEYLTKIKKEGTDNPNSTESSYHRKKNSNNIVQQNDIGMYKDNNQQLYLNQPTDIEEDQEGEQQNDQNVAQERSNKEKETPKKIQQQYQNKNQEYKQYIKKEEEDQYQYQFEYPEGEKDKKINQGEYREQDEEQEQEQDQDQDQEQEDEEDQEQDETIKNDRFYI